VTAKANPIKKVAARSIAFRMFLLSILDS